MKALMYVYIDIYFLIYKFISNIKYLQNLHMLHSSYITYILLTLGKINTQIKKKLFYC